MKKISKKHTLPNPQGAEYWAKRPLNDTEHDWLDDSVNWVKGYADSKDHPHREMILNALKKVRFSSLLEVGCNAGPNLMRIKERYPKVKLAGFDINADSIVLAKKVTRGAHLCVGTVNAIPWGDKLFDVVLCDAVLMYTQPKDVPVVMNELERVAKKAIIIVDRFAREDKVCGHVWGRNYTKLLKELGFKVEVWKITKKQWSTSKNWQKYGRVFIATR